MNNFKELRLRAGLSQYEVAGKLGVRQSTVAMWETGANRPRADRFPELAELFDCELPELFGAEIKAESPHNKEVS